MKLPTRNPFVRTPLQNRVWNKTFNTFRWVGSLTAGAIVGTTLVATQSAEAQSVWEGTTSSEWNEPGNWDPAGVPDGVDVTVNVKTHNVATISGALSGTPNLVLVGRGAGSDGQVNHSAGDIVLGGELFVGSSDATGGGIGEYNLTGSGSLASSNWINIGGGGPDENVASSSGVFNMNTTGSLTVPGGLAIGREGSSQAVFNLEAGTVTTGSWTEIGNFGASEGTLNMSGGSIIKNGEGNLEVGTNGATGTVVQDGGSITVNSGAFRVGNGSRGPEVEGEANIPSNGTYSLSSGTITLAGNFFVADGGAVGTFTQTGGDILLTSGEVWIGNVTHPGGTDGEGNPLPAVRAEGTYHMSGGSISVDNWFVIGRDSGNATFNMSGGTITKGGAENTRFIVGANGTGGTGILNQTGGDITVETGLTWIGENQNGFHTLDDGTFTTTVYQVGVNGPGVGTVELNGGTLTTSAIIGGDGLSNVTFNGTQIVATGENNEFFSGLTNATIGDGGLHIDSAGFNLQVPQLLTGTGGITKTGAGRLFVGSLGSPTGNSIAGDSFVNEGTLVVSAYASASGGFTVADGATLGIFQEFEFDVRQLPHLTFGTSGATTFEIDLNDNPDNPEDAPIDVGTLTLNGDVTVNIADRLPAVGTLPLISYDAAAGTGQFVLGTLPQGMTAELIDDDENGLLYLDVTEVALPSWTGAVDNVWDTTTENWVTKGTTETTTYDDGVPVEFGENAVDEIVTVVLDTTVTPASVTIDNFETEYTLTGSGKISGGTGLTKIEDAPATITGLLNDYTGVTRVQGGTLTIDTLTNGGEPSAIGAAAADPANIVLAGGTLVYTGPAATIDRGFTVGAVESGFTFDNDLTLTGQFATTEGGLNMLGAGSLTFSNSGTSVIGSGGADIISRFDGASLTLDGPAGQVVTFGTRLEVATAEGTQTDIVIDSNTFNTSGMLLGVGANSNTSLIVEGNGTFVSNGRFQTALAADSVSEVIIRDSGSFSKNGGWLSIGNSSNGSGTLLLEDDATLVSDGDFNIADVDQSTGVVTVTDNASLTSNGAMFVGKAGGCNGVLNIDSGTVTVNNWMPIGRFAGAENLGTVNVTGGTLNHTSQYIWVGEEGNGVLNISGTGQVISTGPQVRLTQTEAENRPANGTGVINLGDGTPGGGTLTVRSIVEGDGAAPGGQSTFNFNGGTLIAEAGADEGQRANFMNTLDNAVIQTGGAFIDSNGLEVTIPQALSGSGPLTKLGAGTLTLSGANTYTGNTTVSEGTLAITSPSLPHPATVTIASGATLALNFEGREQVLALVVDGNSLPDGVYDASSPETAGFITGTGEIEVTSEVADPYADWAAANGLTAGVNDGPLDDPDMDGIANLLEFVLGGNPLAADTSILPAAEVTETDFVFTFNRSAASTETPQTFQWSTDLATWNDVTIGATSSGPDGNGVTVTVAGGDPNAITVTVPRTNAADGLLFGRLRVQAP